MPLDLEKYYQNHYWTSSSFVGSVKDTIFTIFQKRRVNWVTNAVPSGVVLDVGSGEGRFSKSLPDKYRVTNIDLPTSSIHSKSVIKEDFLKWNTKKKFDAICFWESLEHTPQPQKYLEKAYKLLNKKGRIFIEYPRYNSFESRLFGKNWFHLDLPRHLSHLTDTGLKTLLKRAGFTNIAVKSVPSFDYAPWGFSASVLNALSINLTDYLKKRGGIVLIILVIPLTLMGILFEIIFLLFNQSPIGLAVARKK